MTNWQEEFLLLTSSRNPSTEELDGYAPLLHAASSSECSDLLKQINSQQPLNQLACDWLLKQFANAPENAHRKLISADVLREVAEQIAPNTATFSALLRVLTAQGRKDDLIVFAEILANSSIAESELVVPSFAFLMQHRQLDTAPLFPRLLDAIQNPCLAGVVLDFCNFLTREKRVSPHPFSEKSHALVDLLGQLANQLGVFEESIQSQPEPNMQSAKQVTESIELAVSLCDAVALMHDHDAIGKLHQLLQLSHRRLRVEAAAALARLKQDSGVQALAELAREPLVRLRVLAYANELGLHDSIEAEFRTEEARAESELILHLSDRTQFGFAPASCELVHRQNQFWPGFDEPVACFLFRFCYPLDSGEINNIGIVGPLTQVLAADLTGLPYEDVYAAFAGWHAEHDEIFNLEIDEQNLHQKTEIQRAFRRLHDLGYGELSPLFIGSFFGERAVVASAQLDSIHGVVIIDPKSESWFPNAIRHGNLSPELCFDIVKGRKLLRAFN